MTGHVSFQGYVHIRGCFIPGWRFVPQAVLCQCTFRAKDHWVSCYVSCQLPGDVSCRGSLSVRLLFVPIDVSCQGSFSVRLHSVQGDISIRGSLNVGLRFVPVDVSCRGSLSVRLRFVPVDVSCRGSLSVMLRFVPGDDLYLNHYTMNPINVCVS